MKRALELKPCPLCKGDAESDLMQGFRRISDGWMSKAVAIYCTKCSVQLSMCYEDHPELKPVEMLGILTEKWNTRTDPDVERVKHLLLHIRECAAHMCKTLCAEDYIPRGRHAPDCPIEYLETANEALALPLFAKGGGK